MGSSIAVKLLELAALNSSFTVTKVPVLAISNCALYSVNFKSSNCEGDHVEAF